MKKPWVSICIPTYNRAPQLKCTLQSLVSQPAFLDGRVEIVISDNASSDNTEALCQEYAARYENILYFRNPQNVADANYPLVLSRANGILRKLNNDTLLIKPGVLDQLCEIAERYQRERPCVFLTNGHCGHGTEQLLNFHDFVVSEGYQITWIASFTIWDDECNDLASDIDGCDLKLWQVRKFYENAFKKNSVLVCDMVFGEVQAVPKKDISYGLFTVFYQNYMKLLSPYVEKGVILGADVETIEKDLLYQFFTPWVIQWEMDHGTYQYSETENLKERVFSQYQDKPYWTEYKRSYQKKIAVRKIKRTIKKLLGRK